MKKLVVLLLSLALLAGCSSKETPDPTDSPSGANVAIDNLKIAFVPSRDMDDIVAVTAPLAELVKQGLATKGYDVANVDISVSTSYETAGEALEAGTVDLGFIPGGTYVLYHDGGVELLVAATRDGLSKDFTDAKSWNDGTPTEGKPEEQVTYYRSLLLAGPSEIGQKLINKVNSGEALTWEDVNEATWCHANPTSGAGYIYPTVWLKDNFDGKTMTDLAKTIQTTGGYSDAAARLASKQCDIAPGYADYRRDYADKWNTDFGREGSIWDEVQVIGVTDGIMNDTISYSKQSAIMTPELVKALQETFIELATTAEGKKAIAIYSHSGYKVVQDSDYDSARKAQVGS